MPFYQFSGQLISLSNLPACVSDFTRALVIDTVLNTCSIVQQPHNLIEVSYHRQMGLIMAVRIMTRDFSGKVKCHFFCSNIDFRTNWPTSQVAQMQSKASK